MLWNNKRFRWGLFAAIIAIMAAYGAIAIVRDPTQVRSNYALLLAGCVAFALIPGVLAVWLIGPVVRDGLAAERARPAPSRAEALMRATKFGLGTLIVAFLPMFIVVLFLTVGQGVFKPVHSVGPTIWFLSLLVSGVLLLRGHSAGATLGAVLSGLAGTGGFVSIFVAGGANASVVLAFALLFVAAPRFWQVRRDLIRTRDPHEDS